jgi:predicted metal-binding protein
MNKEDLDQLIRLHGFADYKWIVPQQDIVVAQWVRFRCMFGCNNYGNNGACPPVVPSIEECRNMIYGYENAVMFHFPMQSVNQDDITTLMARLVKLEREVFLAGCYKAFLLQLGSCELCKGCVAVDTRAKCVNKSMSRPGADAMGVDVYKTAHNVGYPIQVVKDHSDVTNRYAFLLID